MLSGADVIDSDTDVGLGNVARRGGQLHLMRRPASASGNGADRVRRLPDGVMIGTALRLTSRNISVSMIAR